VFFFRAKKYVEYRKRAVNQYGLHSPFLFELFNACFKPKFTHQFSFISEKREELENSSAFIEVADFGAGSMVNSSKSRKVSEMYSSASISKKQGELFNRLLRYFQPQNILELGTHLGISGLYFLEGTDAQLTTIEACKNTGALAQKTLSKFSDSTTFVSGTFREKLPQTLGHIETLDMVYVDGNHDYENTIWHFETLLERAHSESVFIFDDINWSKEMAQAWEEVILHPKVSISVNCFKFGMLFFREGIEKQDFYFKF